MRQVRVDMYWDRVNGSFEVVQREPDVEVRIVIADYESGEVVFDNDPEP